MNRSAASTMQVHGTHYRDYRGIRPKFSGYFTEFTFSKGIFYAVVLFYVLAVCSVVLLDLVIATSYCNVLNLSEEEEQARKTEYGNPSFRHDPCRYVRFPHLLWLNREECSFGRSLLASVLLGGIVGWERRMADRPAGIRTMALVSLGSCLFSINSTFGFIDGPMSWDSSRVAAAIPSGVGFLGAGLIFKEADKDQLTGDTTHVVHGLTTAASLWIVRLFVVGYVYSSIQLENTMWYLSQSFLNKSQCCLLNRFPTFFRSPICIDNSHRLLESHVQDAFIFQLPFRWLFF
jgi:putative Mg2+ transporter-C (MgtC) family protein